MIVEPFAGPDIGQTGKGSADRKIGVGKRGPRVRLRRSVDSPYLGDGSERIARIVVELDRARERVNHLIDRAKGGVVDRNEVAVAVFDLRALVIAALPCIGKLRAVRGAQNHRTAVEQQIR